MGWDFFEDVASEQAAITRWMGDWYEGVSGGVSLERGNSVWYGAIRKKTGGPVFGIVWLVERSGEREFRVKAMSEDMGPIYVDCPKAVLDALTDPPRDEWAENWRDDVRAYHAMREAGVPELVDGSVIRLRRPVMLSRGPNLLDYIEDDLFIVRDRDGKRTYLSVAHGQLTRFDLTGTTFTVVE